MFRLDTELHLNMSWLTGGEGVFGCIGDRLVQHHTDGDRLISKELRVICVDGEPQLLSRRREPPRPQAITTGEALSFLRENCPGAVMAMVLEEADRVHAHSR